MVIDDQDLYHGAALAQIARHPEFTAINVMKLNGEPRAALGSQHQDLA